VQPFEQLEQKYADHLNISSTVSVNTGTAALHVALEALQLPEGSKVIVPEFTMYSSALAVYCARLIPTFVDCDSSLLIDIDKIERAIDDDTRVLMVTHIYGRIVNMDKVMELAATYSLRVIEDACEAQGAMWNNKPVGTFDIGCFSLYRNKIINAEEGGIVASDDQNFLDMVRNMKNMSFGHPHNYYHSQVGFNYRMTNSQALLAINSLEEYPHNARKRRNIENIYDSLLPEEIKLPARSAVWVYDFQSEFKDEIITTLNKAGYAARHGFKPMSMMPLFGGENNNYTELNAYRKSKEIGYLPVHPELKENNIEEICYIVNRVLEGR
jgi:perosamine synthetase